MAPVSYHIGLRIEAPGVTFAIERQTFMPRRILAKVELPLCTLAVGEVLDCSAPGNTRLISVALCRMAQSVAAEVLFPQARALSQQVGAAPKVWEISRGHRVLGRCSSQGIIALSAIDVFLPEQLRRYIILHELAHLTEMNHSQRFHALLQQYLGSRAEERRCVAGLHAFQWPILRGVKTPR